jgi:fructosamine-3-kinase
VAEEVGEVRWRGLEAVGGFLPVSPADCAVHPGVFLQTADEARVMPKPFDTFTVPECELERALSSALGREVRLARLRRLSGGMINSVLLAELESAAADEPAELVIKLSENPRAFSREAAVLRWLAEHTELPVPGVLGELSGGFGMLALEKLEGVNLGRARALGGEFGPCEREMAEAVAALHGHTREEFGPVLGERRYASWVDSYREKLAGFDDETTRSRLDAATLRRVARIVERLEEIVPDRRPARLVHGDIWATNVMVRRDDGGAWRLSGFVDPPGAQFADTEFELAYVLVFRTAGRDFFDRYRDFFELEEGFAFRRLVYHLHTMLVHVRTFGDEHYRRAARDLARDVSRGAGLE